jgi:MraZ protein
LSSVEESISFRGVFEYAFDEKGRISLPAPFRQVLRPEDKQTVVFTNFITDGARCMEGFSLSSWKSLEERLKAKSRFDPKLRKFENFYIARAIDCQIDSQGRVTIPLYLRQYAGIEKDATFTASLYGFRLWDRRVWDMIFTDAESAILSDPALFEGVDQFNIQPQTLGAGK